MNRLSIFASLVLLLALSNACITSQTAARLKSGSLTSGSFTDTIPFELRNGLIVVRAHLNGREMGMDFIWGSGEYGSKLSKEGAAYLGLSAEAEEGNFGRDIVLVDSIRLGDATVEGLAFQLVTYPLRSPARCIAEGGVLGSNFLRHCNWIIDYDQQHIIFSSLEQPLQAKPAHRIPFRRLGPFGRPAVKVQLNGYGKQELIVDLGYIGGVYLNEKRVKKSANAARYQDGVYQRLIGGPAVDGLLLDGGQLQAGSWEHTFQELRAGAGVSKLGSKVWQHYRVGLDYAREELLLWPRSEGYTAPLAPVLGWLPHYDEDGGVSVGFIVEGSPAWEAGLRLDDKIEVIDRRAAPAVFNDYCTYLSELHQRFGTAERMSIKLKKMEQPVTLQANSQ